MIHKLRKGFTTGTCASAAAKAAALFLMEGRTPKRVRVVLGNGETADFFVERGENESSALEGEGWWRVKKDAGDDPDVTDGVWVYGRVMFVTQKGWEERLLRGKGYFSQKVPGIYLNGGPGIGIATKDGLSCPKGHYAINPSPRAVIVQAVEDVRREAGYEGLLEVQIAVPDGVFLAEKTFNPCLGIQGGISVLGTTGIVEPMSESALLETIRLHIRVKKTAGKKGIILTPGNYGEAFLWERLGIPLGEAVKCSNFMGDAVDMAVEEGVRRVLVAGHIGKLVKVAGGVRNTHSKYGDRRMEILGRLTKEALEGMGTGSWEKGGRRPEGQGFWEGEKGIYALGENETRERLLKSVEAANTTEEAVGRLKEAGIAELVLACGAKHVREQIILWSHGLLEAEVVVFSSAHEVMGKTGKVRGRDWL